MTEQPEIPVKPLKGKGDTVIRLGILGMVGLNIFTGLPAWFIGAKNLKNIKAGLVNESEKTRTLVGMILGIVSSIVPLIIITILILGALLKPAEGSSEKIFEGSELNAQNNRAFITGDCYAVGQYAQEYHTANNTFKGFEIPDDYKNLSFGAFEIKEASDESLTIIGIGTEIGNDGENPVTVIATIKPDRVMPIIIN